MRKDVVMVDKTELVTKTIFSLEKELSKQFDIFFEEGKKAAYEEIKQKFKKEVAGRDFNTVEQLKAFCMNFLFNRS